MLCHAFEFFYNDFPTPYDGIDMYRSLDQNLMQTVCAMSKKTTREKKYLVKILEAFPNRLGGAGFLQVPLELVEVLIIQIG